MSKSFADDFEFRLIEKLQMIRGYALSTMVYHMFELGVFEHLKQGPCSTKMIAHELKLDLPRLKSFVQFLVNEGIFKSDGDKVELTKEGETYETFEPWFTLFVGGYGQTFLEIGEKLRSGTGWAIRNTGKVGTASCGIARFDAIPLTKRLIAEISTPVSLVLDVGCGNAGYLIELCRQSPQLRAWGHEPDEDGYTAAIQAVDKARLSDRIRLSCSSAIDMLDCPYDSDPDVLITAFVLHELLAQKGVDGVKTFLNTITRRFPDIYLIIIEVDPKLESQSDLTDGLGLTYYNAYFLLHAFTNQRLAPPKFWESLFIECGLNIVSKQTTESAVDSTGIELGYLLKRGLSG